MENTNIITIEEQEKEDARALTQSFARGDVKSRAYINALGAEVFLKYFEEQNISKERTYNLHNIRKILEEFDISDIKLSNIHIDVRVVFNENQIFIPKTHFEYNLLPDIYVVLKLAKDHSKTEFLGFFEPKLINKNNANDKYYFMEKEKLSSPVDLRNFIENFNRGKDVKYSEEDISHAEFLMVSMTDHDVSEEDKRTLLNYLINSSELRDEFIEYENFEMISYQAASVVGLEVPVNTSEMNVADIPADEMPSDIAEEMLTASEIEALTEDDIVEEQDNKSGDAASGFVKGAAVLGAEIAGTAMASAALSGIAETADSAANIINAAANVANIEADAIDMASSIKNMAEQVFSDENNVVNEHVEVAELPEISEMPAIGNLNIDDFNAELSQAASLEGAELPEVGAEELVNEENSAVQESVQESAVEEQADSNADLVSDDGGVVGEIDELPELGESSELAEVSEDMLQNLSEEDLSLDNFDAEVGVEEQAETASEPDNSEEQTEQQVEQPQDSVEAAEPVEQNDQSGIDEMPDDNLSEPLHSPQENMNSTLDELFADFDASEYSDENDDENSDENSDFSADATSDSNEDSIGDLSDASIDDLDSDSSDDSNNDLGDASIDDLGSELSDDSNNELSDDLISDLGGDSSDDSNNELSDDLINDLGSDSGDDSNNELSDDLISDFGSDSSDELSNVENNDDELVFSNSDDLVFENSDSGDDITYSNDSSYDSGYGDDLVFESSDGGFDDSFDNSPRRSRPVNPLAHGFHTPISEATELTSIEDIQMGNLPKQVTPPPVGDQMETMEMEEFHRLVRNYVPQEIKDESETIGFDNLGDSSALPINANKNSDDEAHKELSDMNSISDTPESAKKAAPAAPVHVESDAYVEDLPDEIPELPSMERPGELTSDNFVEDMPDEIPELPSMERPGELTSDNFVEDMPDEIPELPSMERPGELTSDNFVEDMPDEIPELPSMERPGELTSDNFVEDMPDEIPELPSMERPGELTSDNFVEDVLGLNVEADATAEAPSANEPQTVAETPSTPVASATPQTEAAPAAPAAPATPVAPAAPVAEVGSAPEEASVNEFEEGDLSLLEGLDALSLGELDPERLQGASQASSDENLSNENVEICETPVNGENDEVQDASKLQVLYDGSKNVELNSLELEPELEAAEAEAGEQESYDFRPERKMSKLMPVFAILAAIIIAGSVVGFLMKSKNSIDADTLIQTTPENEILATPEADNSNILANTGETTLPTLPQDAEDVSPNAPAAAPSTPAPVQPEKKEVKPAVQKPAAVKPIAPSKPINGSKTITLKKLSWEVPDYLSYSENIKKYLQTAGKSIKLTLSSDLLLTNEYIYSNQVKVDLKLSKNGDIESARISRSSGSEQVDKIVLRTVKDTLNVVKPASGEVPTPNYNLALIIYL